MKSKVYFISVNDSDTKEIIKEKFNRLLFETNIFDFIRKDDKVAIKLHFGEEENTGYVKPEYIRVAVDKIYEKEAKPVLVDTNTLYRGRRMTSGEHIELSYEHGFTEGIVGAPVLIAEDKSTDININGKFIKIAKIASFFLEVDAIVGIAHFKGHMLTGFGGALKNLGMGCATKGGKLTQHSDVLPFIRINRCEGCGECEKICPVKAIKIINKKAYIDSKICTGCASCIAVCKFGNIDVNWQKGQDKIQKKMVEYAKAPLVGKEKKRAFINFAIKITKECDCFAKDDPKISPDVGILASIDPVSIDKASLDLIIKACKRDIFKEVHPKIDGFEQLHYAEKIGLGNLDYELISLL